MEISFRSMTADDLPLVAQWQLSPEVHKWYGKAYTCAAQIQNRYRAELAESPRRTWHYIIRLDGTDAGMIQTYLLRDYPDYNRFVQADNAAAMIDVFLAPAFLHKGYGKDIICDFLRGYVFAGRLFSADTCAIGPEPDNRAAIRMYEKAGFRYHKTIQLPDEDAPEHIMLITKQDILQTEMRNNKCL